MNKIIIGCDAGLKGGFGVLQDGKLIKYFPTPLKNKKTIDMKKLKNLFQEVQTIARGSSILFSIETQYVPVGQGHSKPIFLNFGLIKGLAYAYFDEVREVSSQTWKTALQLGGGTYSSKKMKSVAYCNEKFHTLLNMKEDGIAEGILIAYYEYILASS